MTANKFNNMENENTITIDGVKHILVKGHGDQCRPEVCSLYFECKRIGLSLDICSNVFKTDLYHFEKEEDGILNDVNIIEIGKLLERKINRRDYILTMEEAKKMLEDGTFDDCDGYVYYCTDSYVSCVEVKNYWDIVEGDHRPEFTKIIIYGK